MGLRWKRVSDDAIGVVDDFNDGSESQNTSAIIIRRSMPREVGEKGKKERKKKEKRTFSTPADTTADPHASIEVQISRVASLHVHIETEGVRFWIDLVSEGGVFKFL